MIKFIDNIFLYVGVGAVALNLYFGMFDSETIESFVFYLNIIIYMIIGMIIMWVFGFFKKMFMKKEERIKQNLAKLKEDENKNE